MAKLALHTNPVVGIFEFKEKLGKFLSNLIFLKGREKIPNPGKAIDRAFKEADKYEISYVRNIDSIEETQKCFDSLYRLEKTILNAELTIAYQENPKGHLPSLYEKIFYSIHRKVGIKRGINPDILPEMDLKREFLLARIRADLLEAFQTVCKDEADKESFARELLTAAGLQADLSSELIGRPSGSSPPIAGPLADGHQPPAAKKPFNRQSFAPKELWLTRTDQSLSPKTFIEAIYKDVLGLISRQDLKHYDEPLYNRLNKWLQKPESDERDAPKNRLPASFGPLARSHHSEELEDLVKRYRENRYEGMSVRDFQRAQTAARVPSRRVG